MTDAPAPPTPHFCSNCGAPLPPDSSYCSKCGSKVYNFADTPVKNTGDSSIKPVNPTPDNEDLFVDNLLAGVLIFFLVVGLAFAGYVLAPTIAFGSQGAYLASVCPASYLAQCTHLQIARILYPFLFGLAGLIGGLMLVHFWRSLHKK
jgi:hypothetical protein